MKKLLTIITLILSIGCMESSSLIVSDPIGEDTIIQNECPQCLGDYHIDEYGRCVCDY